MRQRIVDRGRLRRRTCSEQTVDSAVRVVVHGVEVSLRTVGKDRGDRPAGRTGPRDPTSHQGNRSHTPPPTGVVRGSQGSACPDRFLR